MANADNVFYLGQEVHVRSDAESVTSLRNTYVTIEFIYPDGILEVSHGNALYHIDVQDLEEL